MYRCGSRFLLPLAIAFVLALTGCLGKSSNPSGNGGVASVSLSPEGTISMDVGTTQIFGATGRNATGGTVLGVNIQFVVGVPLGVTTSPPISVASNGNACAGAWDASISICSPGTPGIAIVTAVINGISSAPTTVYVHQHIDSLQISTAEAQPPQYDCFSQGQTWYFQGIAYSGNPPVDISNSVGPMNWSSSNAGVVTATPYVPPNQSNVLNQVQTTAAAPGITQLFASVSGTTSAPFPYTTCLVKAIYLQIAGQGQAGNSITVNNGNPVTITATAIDTLYGIADHAPLAKPPLTWSTTNPEVAAFSTTTNTTGSNSATARVNSGGATVFASCTPPSCNIGVLPGLPIYASDGTLPNGTTGYGTISIDVTLASTAKEPTYTAWAATTDCQDQPGCDSALFAVTPTTTPGKNPIGAIVTLPRTPNSMMFNHLATGRVYLGSDQGLMYVNVGASPSVSEVSSSPIPCNVSLCGKVLTISNDGKQVVVSDTVSTPSQVYIYNSTSSIAPIDLILSNSGETATAAAFSPDQAKIFILTNLGNVYVYSTVDAFAVVPPLTPGTSTTFGTAPTGVIFSADGSFAYVAGGSFAYPDSGPVVPATSISSFATCNAQPTLPDTSISPDSYFAATPAIPVQIFPSPDAQHVLLLDPVNGGIDVFATSDEQIPLPYNQFTCDAPTVNFPQLVQSFDLGEGKNFTPVYAQLVADGTQMIVVARHIPAVILFNVGNGTTTYVPLVGDTDPLSASVSTDGTQVFVATCDQYHGATCSAGSVHIVCTSSCTLGQGDYQDVPYENINDDNNPNMCNGQGAGAPLCLPNLIAIQPQ
jgi:hypothetical protein